MDVRLQKGFSAGTLRFVGKTSGFSVKWFTNAQNNPRKCSFFVDFSHKRRSEKPILLQRNYGFRRESIERKIIAPRAIAADERRDPMQRIG